MDLFLPDPERARLVDGSRRAQVADSLASLSDALAASLPDSHALLDRLIAGLRAGPVRPSVVAIYSDLVVAIANADEAALRAALSGASGLADVESLVPCKAVTLSDADLGPGMAASYRRHADDDPLVALDIVAVDPDTLAQARASLGAVVEWIATADPRLGGEVAALVREVVFAANGGHGPNFDGATTFYLWGATILNVDVASDRRHLAEALVHEAAHCRLLGETSGRPLVSNPLDERYASPLRPDPRPMEGIVHANYVVARLHYLGERILEGRERVAHQAEQQRLFRAGDAIISEHAAFTPAGAAIYRATRDYMMA